jgi:hypothetical protein
MNNWAPAKTANLFLKKANRLIDTGKISSMLSRYPFLSSFLLVMSLICAALLLLTPFFLVNDDVWALFLAKGVGFALHPDPHHFSSNILIGFALNGLYTFAPKVCWYSIYLILGLFLAFWAFLSTLCLRTHQFFKTFLFILSFLFVDLYYFTQLNFTMTSCLVFQGGIFLLVQLFEEKNRIFRWKILCLGASCILLSFLMRDQSFAFSFLSAFPFMVYSFKRKKLTPNVLIFIFSLVLLIVGAFLFDRNQYRQDEHWSKYLDYVRTYTKYHEFYSIEFTQKNKTIFDKIGWTLNDYNLFMDWYVLDDDKYDKNRITALGGYFDRGKSDALKSFLNIFRSFLAQNFLFCFFCFCLFCPLKHFRFVFLNLIWVLAILISLAYFAKIQGRVVFPPLSFLVGLSIYFAIPTAATGSEEKERLPFWAQKLSPIFLIILLILILPTLLRFYTVNNQAIKDYKNVKQSIMSMNPDRNKLFVLWDAIFPYESIIAFDDYEIYRNWHIFALAPYQRSPIAQEMLDYHGVKNLFRDMVDNPNIFLICSGEEKEMYHQYMKEKYSLETRAEIAFKNPCFFVYRITSINPNRRLVNKQ